MTEHIIAVGDFAAAHPKAWRTVRAEATTQGLGYSELAALLRISRRTVMRHLEQYRRFMLTVRATDGAGCIPGCIAGPDDLSGTKRGCNP